VGDGEVVLSFTMHSSSDKSHRGQRQQDIDILGSQTLENLKDAFCCARKRYNHIQTYVCKNLNR
jgi:hypothetical protein